MRHKQTCPVSNISRVRVAFTSEFFIWIVESGLQEEDMDRDIVNLSFSI